MPPTVRERILQASEALRAALARVAALVAGAVDELRIAVARLRTAIYEFWVSRDGELATAAAFLEDDAAPAHIARLAARWRDSNQHVLDLLPARLHDRARAVLAAA